MTNTTSQPQTESELDEPRRILRGIWVVTAFFSAFIAAHGVWMTGQFLNDEVPAGRIEAIVGHTKMGPRLRLDSGREAVFSSQVLFQQAKPVELKVGDQVEKRPGSFAYIVNGTPLTDVGWVLRNWLLPVHLRLLLAPYIIAGTI